MYLPKYRLQKTWIDKCLKSRLSEDPSTENIANRPKQCCNLSDTTFTKFINQRRWKKSFLVTNKILRLFVNTFTADDKHYLLNRKNFAQRIQMKSFLKSILNFKYLPKKDDPHS